MAISIARMVHCELGNHQVDIQDTIEVIVLDPATGRQIGTKYDCWHCDYEEAAAADRADGVTPEPFLQGGLLTGSETTRRMMGRDI